MRGQGFRLGRARSCTALSTFNRRNTHSAGSFHLDEDGAALKFKGISTNDVGASSRNKVPCTSMVEGYFK